MTAFVGIDLGTTYSVVASITPDGKPQAIPSESGRTTVPSVVSFVEGTPIVGDEAKEQQAAGAQDVASFFKRNMGNAQFILAFRGRDYTPTDLSSLVLAHLKAQAEAFLHTPVTDAVITVPAYFTHPQREATIEAGRRAGLRVLSIISEPTAAALAYGLRPSQQTQKVLVYDLGGGTFDVSFVEITPTALTVIGTDGDHQLGGKDWDDRLLNYLQHQFQEEHGIELIGDDFNELLVQAEKLKHTLSARPSAEVRVQGGGQSGTYTVTRAQFEEMTRDLLERTRQLTENVLSDTGHTWADITGVIPVGGSTRMPMVRDLIQQMSGKTPMGGVHPDEAVALGAAIQAAIDMEQRSQQERFALGGRSAAAPTFALSGRKQVQDVIAHSLGMIAESPDHLSYLNSILIRKNQPIPSRETHPYQLPVRRGGETKLEVFLTQGETGDPQSCAYLGLYAFTEFPPLASRVAVLDITYHYDRNGVVQVDAVERSTGKPLKLTVLPVPPDVPERFAGRPIDQQVREHLNVYLVFDLSGSMEGEPLRQAKEAAEKFVKQCDLTTTSIGLITFSDWVTLEQNATQDSNKILKAIHKLKIGGGTTAQPFSDVYHQLHKAPGKSYAIVLTDGVWFLDQQHAIREAKRCHAVPIEVIALGFGDADRAFLDKIASSSEHALLTDLSQLTDVFSTIAQELTEGAGEQRPGGKLRLLR
jgi:molecular chaperone DnaK